MQRDEQHVVETREWFRFALEDLRVVEVELAATPPIITDALFHCQQAAEKALKGFLTWHRQSFRRTHSLEEIGEQCLAIDASLKPVIDPAVPLTEYAWQFRYPGEPVEPTLAEANEGLALARAVYEAVLAACRRRYDRRNLDRYDTVACVR